MSFPFGCFSDIDVIEDENADPNKVYLVDFKYKTIQVNEGEPPERKEVIDWEATSKASAVITGIQPEQTHTSR